MTAYYNELDPLKAEVLREAIRAGAIAPGDVDERSIADVEPADLLGYTQCHFFAGGGFWSLALRWAGWPDDRPVWTGSCPCPSFSAAGKGGGFDDPRHLWPHWFRLIRQSKPAVIFGEQADDAVGYGWLDLVQTDLEAETYAVGKVVFGAHSVGAPHIRQRLYFCADAECWAAERHRFAMAGASQGMCHTSREQRVRDDVGNAGDTLILAHAEHAERWSLGINRTDGCNRADCGRAEAHSQPGACSEVCELGQPEGRTSPLNGFWRDADWIGCRDGKFRPVEPCTFPLAHGSTARVGRLRLYGDGIVVTQAQAFIESYLDIGE